MLALISFKTMVTIAVMMLLVGYTAIGFVIAWALKESRKLKAKQKEVKEKYGSL